MHENELPTLPPENPDPMDTPEAETERSPVQPDEPQSQPAAPLDESATAQPESGVPSADADPNPEAHPESADPVSGAMEASPPADLPDPAEPGRLREELNRLLSDLREARAAAQRVRDEYAEFGMLYPDVPVQAIPDDAWEDIRRGIPIAAAYALSERRREHTSRVADDVNRRNADRSSGAVSGEAPSFFTAREVRAMTPAEVRENYRKILLSMPKWNAGF